MITKRKKVATVLNTPVYAAQDFSVFPIERSTTVALLGQPDEAYLLGLLKSHLYSAPFYYTYGGYDVTKRVQEQSGSDQALWESVSPRRRGVADEADPLALLQADDRFFWNKHLQRRLIDISTGAGDKDVSFWRRDIAEQADLSFFRSASASSFL